MSSTQKFRPYALFALFCMTMCGAVSAASGGDSQERDIRRMERFIYGSALEGAPGERLKNIEKDLLGRHSRQGVPEKIRNLNSLLFTGTKSAPSLCTKLNYLEWKVFHETRQGKLSDRIAALDTFVIGNATTEPMAFRVEQLIHLSIESGIISLHQVKIPSGTSFRVKLGKKLSSKTSIEGEEVPISLSDDFLMDRNILLIAKGGAGIGEIDKVKHGGRFGRTGYLKLLINEIPAIDGSMVPVKITDVVGSALDKKKIGMAIGASALGYLAMGPVGLVGGAFIKGQDVEVPAGTELVVSTTQDFSITGILVNR